jgi:hypothetical protein
MFVIQVHVLMLMLLHKNLTFPTSVPWFWGSVAHSQWRIIVRAPDWTSSAIPRRGSDLAGSTWIFGNIAVRLSVLICVWSIVSYCRYASESGEQSVLESMKDYLISTIQRTFEVSVEQAECLYSELLQCTRKKNLVSSCCAGFALK